LADQKYTLENLIEFLKKHESDANVAAVKADFEGLMSEYNKLTETDPADAKGSKDSKAAVFSGGKQLVMTEAVYKAVVEKVKAIRNSYTNIK